MYVIVIGCGRVGAQLASLLSTQGCDVVVIDNNSRAFRRLGGTFNGITIEGVGFDEDVLREAGAEKADALAAVTDLDNTNLMIAEIAKRIFKIPKVVARLYNPEKEASYQQFGIDYVCGTSWVATRILDKIVEGRISYFTSRDAELTGFSIADALTGKKVKDIEIPEEVRVAMIKRDDSDIIPSPDTILLAGDRLVLAIKRKSLPKIKNYIKK